MKKLKILLLIAICFSSVKAQRWSEKKANNWFKKQAWPIGCNFIPSNAINQLEMWQANTFDPAIIDKELGWAEELGFNTMRVYLHYLVWQENPEGFKQRMSQFLDIIEKHNMKVMFVLFDDCWNGDPKLGKQPEPIPSRHNSGWVQCPGQKGVTDTDKFPIYKAYTQDVLKSFSKDKRILLWDLYNEPSNTKHGLETLPLLKKVFGWAREMNAKQPITSGVWNSLKEMNEFILSNSDIISFHNYSNAEHMQDHINELKKYNRPLICSEYMARTNNSKFETHLPIMKKDKVGAINWGLVAGKTNTIFPWDSKTKKYGEEPPLWFHDILRQDGTPYKKAEVNFIKKITNK